MSTTNNSRGFLRSVGVVLVAFVLVAVFSLGTDIVLHATRIYPPWFKSMSTPLWLLATGYRTVYCIAGCYIAARLASYQPVKHALALGILGFVVSTVGVVATWNKGPEFGPHWYPLALVATAIPCAWVGGKLGSAQTSLSDAS